MIKTKNNLPDQLQELKKHYWMESETYGYNHRPNIKISIRSLGNKNDKIMAGNSNVHQSF